ncbi:MAG: FliH/SctL family protein [Terracidiphilus sp.]
MEARGKGASRKMKSVGGRIGAGGEIEVLEYPVCPGAPSLPAWEGWVEAEEADVAEPAGEVTEGVRGSAAGAAMAERMAEEACRSFEAGQERGRQEGLEAEREAQAAAAAENEERRKRQMAALIERFQVERDRYLRAVEQEVVKLALAVAARILRREAQMDPLLLTGAVRVALGQLAASSEVRLRVPAAELELWTEAIAHLPNLTMKPAVAAGEGMRLGDCMIESKVGTVDLGVRSQLGEIERGFFDRAGANAREILAAGDAGAGEAQA